MKYRNRVTGIEIEATQWFKNGDHPDDECEMIHPDPNSTTQFYPFLSDGKIVKPINYELNAYPDCCEECNRLYKDHGLINTPHGKMIVCPEDWVIKTKYNKYYLFKSSHGYYRFKDVFELIEK